MIEISRQNFPSVQSSISEAHSTIWQAWWVIRLIPTIMLDLITQHLCPFVPQLHRIGLDRLAGRIRAALLWEIFFLVLYLLTPIHLCYTDSQQSRRMIKKRRATQRRQLGRNCKLYQQMERGESVAERLERPGIGYSMTESVAGQEKGLQSNDTIGSCVPTPISVLSTKSSRPTSLGSVADMAPAKVILSRERPFDEIGGKTRGNENRSISDTIRTSQTHLESSKSISKAMTTSFYGREELESLQRRFPPCTWPGSTQVMCEIMYMKLNTLAAEWYARVMGSDTTRAQSTCRHWSVSKGLAALVL